MYATPLACSLLAQFFVEKSSFAACRPMHTGVCIGHAMRTSSRRDTARELSHSEKLVDLCSNEQ